MFHHLEHFPVGFRWALRLAGPGGAYGYLRLTLTDCADCGAGGMWLVRCGGAGCASAMRGFNYQYFY